MHCVLACAVVLCALLGVGTAAPQERPVGLLSTVQGKACQVVSVVLIIVLRFTLYLACTTAGGCSGYCGGYSSSGSCYCDDLCTSYGDCCADYLDVCSKSISHA